jgi:hypothetical protein
MSNIILTPDLFAMIDQAGSIDSERTTTDWATIAARFNPSRQLVSAHTTLSIVQSIRFSKA